MDWLEKVNSQLDRHIDGERYELSDEPGFVLVDKSPPSDEILVLLWLKDFVNKNYERGDKCHGARITKMA